MILRSRRALRRLLWQPGELGLAQAYVTGELDVEGDLADGLRTRLGAGPRARPDRAAGSAGRPRSRRSGLRRLGSGVIGPAPAGPGVQAKLQRAPAQQAARPGRDQPTTTTCPTSSTR